MPLYPETDIWVKRDGTKINVGDMTTAHLKNVWRTLKRKGFVPPSTIDSYLGGAGPQGDYARDAFDREADYVFSCPVCPQMDFIENELKLRGEKSFLKQCEDTIPESFFDD